MKLYFCLHQLATDVSNTFSHNRFNINTKKVGIPYAWIDFSNIKELRFFHTFYAEDNSEKSTIHWVWYTYKKL